jgi:23S rRNA pseudouridine1911/1915/1917 synthase
MQNSFHIICDREDIRLDVFLSEKLSITRTKVKDMVEGGHVRVSGKTPKASLKIKKSMEIEGEIPEDEPLSLTPEDIPLEVLYEDEYFLAINKPADMVVHPSFGHSSGTLVNAVLSYLGRGSEATGNKVQGTGIWNLESEGDTERMKDSTESLRGQKKNLEPGTWNLEPAHASVRPGIVHRLDKGTTGVILVAKDSKTQEMLSHLFKERNVKKTYRAIVEGNAKKEQWTVEGNVGRHPVERKKMAVLKTGGRSAETSFKVLTVLREFTYLEVYPKTGRTHQIRVHVAYAGYPIAGDEAYGKKAKTLAPRPLLHAYRIEFIHPVKDIPVKIEAPVPVDMEEFIKAHL